MHHQRYTLTTFLKALFFILLAGGLAACDGGSSSSLLGNPGNGPNDPDPSTVDLEFLVQSYDGGRLSDVTVTLDGSSAQSDEDGLVQFTLPSQDSYVVRAEADGFITQALKVTAEQDAILSIRLTPVKQTLVLNDIEAARTLSASHLGARITFPANAFVTAGGDLATGEATVQVTPWDITNGELNAMPGNGQAIDASGESTELISAGMITVNVQNEAGDSLQLAPDTTAEIQMDLPLASINNEPLSVGSTIPMWHFDEDQGEWVEDDSIMGTVVASATSPVGLAVYAQVSHFSTWNWDFKFENGGSIHVECRLTDDTAVPCRINAEVVLDDNSIFSRAGYLPEGGSTIINMPNSATIHWMAISAGGMITHQTSDMSGDVVLELDLPSSDNQVRCLLPDGTPAACVVTLTDGTQSLTHFIPAAGAGVVTDWPNLDEFTELEWVAELASPISYEGEQVVAEGTVTSGISGEVNIDLETTPVDEVTVECLSTSGTAIPCIVDYIATLANGDTFTDTGVMIQQNPLIAIPSGATLIQWSAESQGAFSQNGQFVLLEGSMETAVESNVAIVLDEEAVQGPAAQSVQVQCINGLETVATTCDIEVYAEGELNGYMMLGSFADIPVGDAVTVEFPEGMSQNVGISLVAIGYAGSQVFDYISYELLTNGETIELELQCADTGNGTSCP